MTNSELVQKFLAGKNVILLALNGSQLYGTATSNSDTDLLGVFIEDPTDILNFGQPNDTYVFRTAAFRENNVHAESKKGDYDVTLYGLRKFLKLALVGNPNVIPILFADAAKPQIAQSTGVGIALQCLRNSILSKRIVNPYLGFMEESYKSYCEQIAGDVEKLSERAKKEIKTCYTLANVCSKLLKTGSISFPLEINKSIEKLCGGYYSPRDTQGYLQENIRSVKASVDIPVLQEQPNTELVKQWMINTYLDAWSGKQVQIPEEEEVKREVIAEDLF